MSNSEVHTANHQQSHHDENDHHRHHAKHERYDIKFSLLDITYPYYHESMLAKSKFFGFQCLIFESGIYFCIMYIVSNYINKGYFLKWDILQTIANNLVEDTAIISTFLALSLLQMYLTHLISKIYHNTNNKLQVMYAYCFVWLCLFVLIGLYVINAKHFYFTDRIFIVVVSWALPVKTASYCIDYSNENRKNNEDYLKVNQLSFFGRLLLLVKFLISPKIIYSEFITVRCDKLKIHGSYLLIKLMVASVCLLINYILLTQIINPLLQPSSYRKMSFIQLFFRLIPCVFYVNICLYYLIMENILQAMAEITQLKDRVVYEDWWNAETISEFLDKWVLLINSFSNTYLHMLSKQLRHVCNLTIIFFMLFSIFNNRISFETVIFAVINIAVVYFLGEKKAIQNNYIVHFLTISFTPFCIAAQLKYSFFR